MKRRNLFKPDASLALPTSSHRGGSMTDGSGRGVRMDAPIVKSWKSANGYTKGSYYWLLGSLVLMVWSYKHMMYHYGMLLLLLMFLLMLLLLLLLLLLFIHLLVVVVDDVDVDDDFLL